MDGTKSSRPAANSQSGGCEGPWQALLFENVGAVGLLTLNRPERMNVMDIPMREELAEVFNAIRANHKIRAVVVTGAGDAFCAGGDVNDFVGQHPTDMHDLMREASHRWFRALWNLPIPTIAAVNGVAAGGGTNLALACDMVLASTEARFGQTFSKVGLMPDLGGVFLLPRAVGLHRAKAMCLTGDLINATQALELGFVHKVVEPSQIVAQAMELGRKLADKPQAATAATKMALNRSFELSMEETLQFELYAQSYLFSTESHEERLKDFLTSEKTSEAGTAQ